MPRLANQREDHLLEAMREYKSRRPHRLRRGDGRGAQGLTEGDLEDLAYFLARLPRAAP